MGRKPNPAVRERIEKEAEHILHLRGYHAAGMEEIARACKMTKANLFHHYDSKEALALAVLDAKIADYQKRRVSPLCECLDPVEAVSCLFDDCEAFFKGNGCKAGCFVANIAGEMTDASEAFRKRIGAFFGEWVKGMAARFERAKKEGFFKPTLDSTASAEAILSLYEGAILLARTSRDPSIFTRVGPVARAILEPYKVAKGGK